MRVLLVDPVSYTRPYDHNLAAALARRGHVVDLVAARFLPAEPPAPDGYRVHEVFFTASARLLRGRPRSRLRFVAKGAEYLPSLRRFLHSVKAADPDVVHVQWLGIPQLDVRWLRSVARDRPLVFTAHDVLPRRTEQRVDLWRRIFAAVDRVVVHSDRAAERLAEIGVESARVAVVPHPLFAGPPGGELTTPSGRTLLFFGLLRGSKGLDLLLRAFPAVLAAAPGTRLVIAGDPLDPIEPLQRLAADLGLTGHVEWRIGYLPDEAVPALMEKATAVVLPYRKIESSGVLATALGHGRPAVVTDVGSLGDTVRTYSAGLVVPPEDVDALAQACIRLLTDEDALSEAFAGTKRALAELTWEAAALAHERLYDEVRAARRARTPTGSEAGTRI